MSIWADINRRSQGIQVKKEDKPEPKIDPFFFTFYDAEENSVKNWLIGGDTEEEAYAELKARWRAREEEVRRKREKDVIKARKEKKFLDIWDCICVISIILLVVSLASLCIWTVIKGPDYIPGWLFGTVTISGCIGIIMSGAGQGTFNEMRKHVDEYME